MSQMEFNPERLIDARASVEMTQEKLAEKVGCTHSAISAYENGKRIPRNGRLLKIAKALGVPKKVLCSGAEQYNDAVTKEIINDLPELEPWQQAEILAHVRKIKEVRRQARSHQDNHSEGR